MYNSGCRRLRLLGSVHTLMELYQLIYLKEIFNCRSYTKAAATLKRTPSALTIAIQKLEAELGVQLFYKRGRLIEPSKACRKLIPIIEQTLYDVKKLVGIAADTSSAQDCTINLGIPDLFYFNLIKMKEDCASRGINVYVHKNDQLQLEEDLKLGKLDMAILCKPLSHPMDFICMDYRREEFFAYCPAASPYAAMEYITPDTLSSAVLMISREMRTFTPFIFSYLKQYAVPPMHLCNDILDLYNAFSLAQVQNGIVIAPRFTKEVEGMTALPIIPPLTRDLVIAWDIGARQTDQQKELAQYILECVPPDRNPAQPFEVVR